MFIPFGSFMRVPQRRFHVPQHFWRVSLHSIPIWCSRVTMVYWVVSPHNCLFLLLASHCEMNHDCYHITAKWLFKHLYLAWVSILFTWLATMGNPSIFHNMLFRFKVFYSCGKNFILCSLLLVSTYETLLLFFIIFANLSFKNKYL